MTGIFRNKTWKEELSIAIVVYLMYLGIVGAVGPLEILVWPFMAFVTAAFGMDVFGKLDPPDTSRLRKQIKED